MLFAASPDFLGRKDNSKHKKKSSSPIKTRTLQHRRKRESETRHRQDLFVSRGHLVLVFDPTGKIDDDVQPDDTSASTLTEPFAALAADAEGDKIGSWES
jgi:hypothetical protein